jgi:hypothetical protein
MNARVTHLQMTTNGLIALPSPDPEVPGRDNTADGNSECLRAESGDNHPNTRGIPRCSHNAQTRRETLSCLHVQRNFVLCEIAYLCTLCSNDVASSLSVACVYSLPTTRFFGGS